jgi:hypothetical protein
MQDETERDVLLRLEKHLGDDVPSGMLLDMTRRRYSNEAAEKRYKDWLQAEHEAHMAATPKRKPRQPLFDGPPVGGGGMAARGASFETLVGRMVSSEGLSHSAVGLSWLLTPFWLEPFCWCPRKSTRLWVVRQRNHTAAACWWSSSPCTPRGS